MPNNKAKPKTIDSSPEILMLGYLCIKDNENLKDKVDILDKFGFADNDIAIICGAAVQSIRNARQLRKSKAEKRKSLENIA